MRDRGDGIQWGVGRLGSTFRMIGKSQAGYRRNRFPSLFSSPDFCLEVLFNLWPFLVNIEPGILILTNFDHFCFNLSELAAVRSRIKCPRPKCPILELGNELSDLVYKTPLI